MTGSLRKALLLLVALGAVLVLAPGASPGTAEGQGHSAGRTFSPPHVEPGGTLEVTITASGYGPFGQVVETLPEGFTYRGSSLAAAAVTVEGRTVSFVLFGDESFTYSVTVPEGEGSYDFQGIIRDAQKTEQSVGGSGVLTVGSQPPPPPTAPPQPTAPATSPSTDTAGSSPAGAVPQQPADTPTPAPTATPPPTPTATPEPTPEPTAAAAAPQSAPTAPEPGSPSPGTPGTTPSGPTEQEGGPSPWLWIVIAVIVAAIVVAAAVVLLRRYR